MARPARQKSHSQKLLKKQADPAHSSISPLCRTAKPPPRSVSIAGKKLPVSTVFDTFFYFATERHKIHQRRVRCDPAPWTKDKILARWPFANIYRVYDRTTQYILHHVIQQGDEDLRESWFRVILFRTFNKIATWELLKKQLGELTWRDFDIDRYEHVLLSFEGPLYSGAYIIPGAKLGAKANVSNHLRLIKMMMEEDVPGKLCKLNHLKDAHGYLRLYPSMGDFTALQLLLDLNMTPFFRWSEDEWVALGPGSLGCIRKMFGPQVRGYEFEALKYLHSTQHSHFARLGLDRCVPRLHPQRRPGLSMVDIEHVLCEVEKYSREHTPEIRGKRSVVGKRLYHQNMKPLTADLPAHWFIRPSDTPDSHPCPPPVATTSDSEPLYEVSHIVSERPGRYLVRWTGYSPDEDTWENEANLSQGANGVLKKWQSMKARIEAKVAAFQAMGDTYNSLR